MNQDKTTQLGTSSLQSLAACPERYEIKALIGQGGMGMVFCAHDKELLRDVAIKVLLFEGSREEESQQRFLREARTLDTLQHHPNIVNIYSSGLNAQGNPYHVMEYLEGSSLSKELAAGPLDAKRFYELFRQVLSGLAYAHERKVVHRDLKPSNIMHCKDADGSDLYKIIDFGIARIDQPTDQESKNLTRTNAILGSPLYASPEQCRGDKVDHLSDIYSIGCIMFECIRGTPPFLGETSFETMYKHMTEESVRLDLGSKAKSSIRLASLIERCLQKKAENRPQTVSEISAELNQIFAENTGKLDLFSPGKKTRKPNKTLVVYSIVSAFALITFSTIGLGLLRAQNNASTKEFTQKLSEQGKVSSLIERTRSKLDKWNGFSPSAATTLQREHFLNDLFALGRLYLKSDLKKDHEEAEKLYSRGLTFCNASDYSSRSGMIACLVLRAKAKWKLGRFAESEADFNSALKIAKSDQKFHEHFIDIMLERPLLFIHTARYADAFNDYMIAVHSFEDQRKDTSVLAVPEELTRFNQTLDPLGNDRVSMTATMAEELRKMKPATDQEASDMVILANRLALSLWKIKERKDSRLTLQLSESLLDKISGNAKLRKDVMELHKTIK